MSQEKHDVMRRQSRFVWSGRTMLDKAQRERMQRNREIALLRLCSRASTWRVERDDSSAINCHHQETAFRPPPPPPPTTTTLTLPAASEEGCREGMNEGRRERVQDFEYLVVIDFESTCDTHVSFSPQEIIEFPSVLVSCQNLQMHDTFQTYVKPIYHPTLTNFCKQFTGIKQSQVDAGVSLGEALDMHDKWLTEKGIKAKKFVILTWTDWDCKVMLESECKLKGLNKPPYFDRWINLKVPFKWAFHGLKCDLKTAVQAAGLAWEGRAHCGLDDAKNTARIALELMRRGINLRITTFSASYDAHHLSTFLADAGKSCLENSAGPTILCYCGVHSMKHMVNKPGPAYGRYFLSCGRGTLRDGGKCHFFQWIPSVPSPFSSV